jgi:hypothetical protein
VGVGIGAGSWTAGALACEGAAAGFCSGDAATSTRVGDAAAAPGDAGGAAGAGSSMPAGCELGVGVATPLVTAARDAGAAAGEGCSRAAGRAALDLGRAAGTAAGARGELACGVATSPARRTISPFAPGAISPASSPAGSAHGTRAAASRSTTFGIGTERPVAASKGTGRQKPIAIAIVSSRRPGGDW